MRTDTPNIYRNSIKRVLDLIFSLIVSILLCPLFIIVGILIKIDSRGPVFFFQDRMGKDNQKFKIYKFRTMVVNNAEDTGVGIIKAVKDDDRITKVGKVLRALSLDELPQIINIVKGDMSFVGPRPTIEKVVLTMSKEDRKRHMVRPGITGLAQVNGRQSLNWEQKIKYDLKYIDEISFMLDVGILFKTIPAVLKQEAIYKDSIQDSAMNESEERHHV